MAHENLSAPLANKSLREVSVLSNFDYAIEAIASVLFTYYTPFIVIVGGIGNMLSFFIFCVNKLRLVSTRIYLSVLAISDSLFLLQLLPPWLSAMQITSIFHRYPFCQIVVYISYVSSCLSAWLVVAFTVERFVAVVYPLQRNVMFTVARAKCVVCLITVFAVVSNLPLVIFASPSVNDCNIDSYYIVHAAWFNVSDTVISFWAPFAIIAVLNTLIMIDVYRVNRARRVLQAQQATDNEQHGLGANRRRRVCQPPNLPPQRAQHKITRMLLIVSTVFVGLNVPAYTMRILAYAYGMNTAEYTGSWAAMQQIALTLFNTNYGINFLLYCLTGQNFRRALRQAIPCLQLAGAHRRVNALRLRNRNPAQNPAQNPDRLSSIASIHDEELVREFNRNLAILNDYCERLARVHQQPSTPLWHRCW